MFDDAVRSFLQKPLIARLSTIGSDGYPHSVPVWFLFERDIIVFVSDRHTRKTQNAVANPKGAVVIGGDSNDGGGYLIRGDFNVEDDPGQKMTHQMIDRYEDKESGDQLKEAWKNDDIVVIRLHPVSVVKVI